MNTLKQSFAAKLLAVILLCAAALCFTGSAAAGMYLYDSGAYTVGYEEIGRAHV